MSAEEILKHLLENYFFVNGHGGVEWSYQEGTSVADMNEDFQKELLPYLPDDMQHEIENAG